MIFNTILVCFFFKILKETNIFFYTNLTINHLKYLNILFQLNSNSTKTYFNIEYTDINHSKIILM